MRMRKFTALLVTAVMAIGVTAGSVFAAPSKTAKVTSPDATVAAVDYTGIKDDDGVKTAIKTEADTGSIDAFIEKLNLVTGPAADSAKSIAGQIKGASVIANFFDLKSSSLNVTLNVTLPSDASVDNIRLVHFSTARYVFELVTPTSVDASKGEIKATFQDLGPVAIIKLGSSSTTATSTSSVSPKTGVSNTWVFFGLAAVAAAGAAVVVFKKERV